MDFSQDYRKVGHASDDLLNCDEVVRLRVSAVEWANTVMPDTTMWKKCELPSIIHKFMLNLVYKHHEPEAMPKRIQTGFIVRRASVPVQPTHTDGGKFTLVLYLDECKPTYVFPRGPHRESGTDKAVATIGSMIQRGAVYLTGGRRWHAAPENDTPGDIVMFYITVYE